ncbi:MAG: hypothetical protein WCT32_03870 [Patescibacteria group bacterium]|jgi:hypothetical protein
MYFVDGLRALLKHPLVEGYKAALASPANLCLPGQDDDTLLFLVSMALPEGTTGISDLRVLDVILRQYILAALERLKSDQEYSTAIAVVIAALESVGEILPLDGDLRRSYEVTEKALFILLLQTAHAKYAESVSKIRVVD